MIPAVVVTTFTPSRWENLLKHLIGYRLSNENAMKPVREWRKIDCSNIVKIFDAFTCRSFGDSSLILVQDYHPLSKTLMEVHFPAITNQISRYNKNPITEQILWSYIAQIANALRTIHSANLAARCIDLAKILLTDKNRIRLGACSILDVLQFEPQRPVADLQQEDFLQFGKCILCLATDTPPSQLTNGAAAMEQLGRTYSPEFRDTVTWLLTPQASEGQKSIGEFVRGISSQIISSLDSAFHANDALSSDLYKSLESDRLARLLMKLGTINERGEYDGDPQWSEHGERYMMKLFRDYVFHQVDVNGNPVVDPGHMLRCLNKLDVGTDERICLTSRDDQTVFIVTYKELKRQFQSSFNDLFKNSKNQRSL
jgi:PAB-dependent poly(A)-specific ribonuclease subunit 3